MDITVQELKSRIDAGSAPIMIDVREPHECDRQHLPGVELIPMGILPYKLQDMVHMKDEELVLICRSGNRSGRATGFMKQQGFSKARNLAGGMLAWKSYIDPTFDVE